MRLYLYPFILLCCLSADMVFAQGGFSAQTGARSRAMGGAAVTQQDVFSLFSNPAGIAHLESLGFGISGENRFLQEGLNQYQAAVALPSGFGGFGLSVQYFGFDLYNEQKIGLAYARKLTDFISVGVQFDYLSVNIQEFGNKGTFTFEAGVQSNFKEQFYFGAHVFSPARVSVTDDDVIPTVMTIGGAWKANDKLWFAVDVEKDIDLPVSFQAGFEYFIVDELALRAGVSTAPVENHFGIGIYLGQLRIDLSSSYHQTLGITPSASISYSPQLKAKPKEQDPS
ncbi:MAG: hypothetical protein AAF598_05700 [Bacteroidota bacterium]